MLSPRLTLGPSSSSPPPQATQEEDGLSSAWPSPPPDLPCYSMLMAMCGVIQASRPRLANNNAPLVLLCSHPWGPLILLSALQARSTDSLDGPGEGSVQPLPPTGGPSVKGKPGKR